MTYSFLHAHIPPASLASNSLTESEITMFGTVQPDTERPAHVTNDELVVLSHLQLDIEQPPEGWNVFLAGRGIEVVEDDLARPAIARADARRLFAEQRELAQRRTEALRRADEAAIEFDRQFRASIGAGIPASAIPAGATYAEAMLAAEFDSRTYQPRRTSMAEDLFDNSGGLVFHPTISQPDEE